MTFHLFVCALAGAGAAVVAMVRQDIKKISKPQKHQNTKQCCKLLNQTLARNFPLFKNKNKFAESQVKLRRYGVNRLWSGHSYCHNCSTCAGARNKKKTRMGEKAFWRSGKDCDSLPPSVGGARHVMVVVMETTKKKGTVIAGNITQ